MDRSTKQNQKSKKIQTKILCKKKRNMANTTNNIRLIFNQRKKIQMKKYLTIIMFLIIISSSYALTNDNIFSYYKYDGDVLDAVGNADGTNQGTTSDTVDYYLGTASRSFDGTNDYIDNNHQISDNHNWSISLFFKRGSTGTYDPVFGTWTSSNGFLVRFHASTNSVDMFCNGNSVNGNPFDNTTGFHAMVTNYDAGANELKTYIDGTLYATKTSCTYSMVNDLGVGVYGVGITSQVYDGNIDEFMFKNQTMSSTEINEWSALATQYPFGGGGVTADNVTLTAKDWINNSLINNYYAHINGTWYNSSNETTITTTILDNATQLFNITYKADGFINRTYLNVNISSGSHQGILTQSATNWVNIYVYDSNTQAIANPQFEIGWTNGNEDNIGNPTQINLLDIIDEENQTENIQINITDLDLYNQPYSANHTINRTTKTINITMNFNELVLKFKDIDGNDVNIFALISHGNESFNSSSTNFTYYQNNLTEGNVKIKLRWNNSEEYTQFYEYYNDYSEHVIKNITMLKNMNLGNFSVRAVGNTENTLANALIQQWTLNPSDVSQKNLFLGQRITSNEAEGKVTFNTNIARPQVFSASKDGYLSQQTNVYTGLDLILWYNFNNPLEIELGGGGITQTRGITLLIPTYTRNKSINIPIYIHSPTSNNIKILTEYMNNTGQAQRGLVEENTNDVYYTQLSSGTHFSNGAGDITIYIYRNNIYHSTYTITDKSTETNTDLVIKPSGLNEQTLYVILAIMIIIISGIISTQIDHEDSGIIAFFGGTLILTLINTTFVWVVVIPLSIMVGKKIFNLSTDE